MFVTPVKVEIAVEVVVGVAAYVRRRDAGDAAGAREIRRQLRAIAIERDGTRAVRRVEHVAVVTECVRRVDIIGVRWQDIAVIRERGCDGRRRVDRQHSSLVRQHQNGRIGTRRQRCQTDDRANPVYPAELPHRDLPAPELT